MTHANLKPDWTNRRQIIKLTLRVMSFFLFLSLIGATSLAYFTKFTFYITIFYTVFAACSFVLMLGIIGSYVFGARWETKDFLNAMSDIVPDFQTAPQPHHEPEPEANPELEQEPNPNPDDGYFQDDKTPDR